MEMYEEGNAKPGQPLQESTPGSGKNTPEYNRVLTLLSKITKTLSSNPPASQSLKQKMMEKKWLDCTSNPTAEGLLKIILGRIELDVNVYGEFVSMLKTIEGMDQIVKKLPVTHCLMRNSDFQAHNLAAITEQLTATSLREKIHTAVESTHEARCEAIRTCFSHIHEKITHHIDDVLVEAYSQRLIDRHQMNQWMLMKCPQRKKALMFLDAVSEAIETNPVAYDAFIKVLRAEKYNFAQQARIIERTAQEEVQRKSRTDSNASAQPKPELDSGVRNNTLTSNTEQPSSCHPEPFSEPVGSDVHLLSQQVGVSHQLSQGRSNVNSSGSMERTPESIDGNTIPQQTAILHKGAATAEENEEGHPQVGLSRAMTPVSETRNQYQGGNGSSMVKYSAPVHMCSEMQLKEENERLSKINKELELKCVKLQNEKDNMQREIEKLSKETKELTQQMKKIGTKLQELGSM